MLLIYTPNCIDTPAITWGTHWAGGVVSPANPGYTVEELVFQLKDSGAKALCTQAEFLPVALEACKRVGIDEDRVIIMGDGKSPSRKIKHFTAIRNMAGTSRYRKAKINPKTDLAFLVYSSGTTGYPKGVMLSHSNLVANVMQLTVVEGVNLTWKTDKILGFLPFFHIYVSPSRYCKHSY